ncbi:hypothetical protein [Desulfogranum marinum]|jgi:hypothetical protein|uniref:hypothetical protein n=1 Tax=Desulfogranum marinum TaxID=453220 RepID=UPI0029C9B0ED|nr:hypothetical protein [Desulfogranum marinum]
MKKRPHAKYVMGACILFLLFGPSLAIADDYWSVQCTTQGYGIDFNLKEQKAFIIFSTDSGGTIPAASTTKIIKFVNKPNDKYAIFDFGSATKIGVNVSRPDRTIIYRLLQGKTYPVCDAKATIRTP